MCSIFPKTFRGAYWASHWQNTLLINARVSRHIGTALPPTQWHHIDWDVQIMLAKVCVGESLCQLRL